MIDDTNRYYNVIIVGAGPSGLFTAYEIAEKFRKKMDILIIDRGKPLMERSCQALTNKCVNCKECELIAGGGGAGLFSDGKLVLDIYSGGYLNDIISIEEKNAIEQEIIKIIEKFVTVYIYKKPSQNQEVLASFEQKGLRFKPYPVVHLGSNVLKDFTSDLISYLQQKKVKFIFNTEVLNVIQDSSSNIWQVEISNNGALKKIKTHHLVFAVGKEGNFWYSSTIERLGGKVEDNSTYMGIRMEINDTTAKYLYKDSLDPKICRSFKDVKIKTHCFCRHGQILLLKYFGLPLVGGHSPFIEMDADYNPTKFPNSNFAILYRDKKICTWKNAIEIMKEINKITKGNLLVQRLGDYLDDIPTTLYKLNNNSVKPSNTNVTPGHIPEDILPGFREVYISFLEQLDSCIPNIMHPDNLLYVPAIEWWMRRIKVRKNMEVLNLPNLYAIGDGSGWTQGIFQSIATGVLAGIDISKKLGNIDYTSIGLISNTNENMRKWGVIYEHAK